MRKCSIQSAAGIAAVLLALAGCTVHPPGEREERHVSRQAGREYEKPVASRSLPELPNDPTPEQLVNYALLSNAGVEESYWQWRSALEQVPQEGTQKSNLMVSYSAMISHGTTAASMHSLGAGSDPMNNIVLPDKLKTAAMAALENARAAGIRFDQARFKLRAKVLWAYDDFALTAELARLEQMNANMLELTARITQTRLGAGVGMQQDVLKAANELDLSNNEFERLQSALPRQRAILNALLNRSPDAPLNPPGSLPSPSRLPGDGADLLALASRNNPELRALAREAAARAQAVRRAKQEYWPDFSVNVSTDPAGTAEALMGPVMVPALRHEAIDAAIRQARADLRANEALQRQEQHDVASRVVGDLAMLHDAQRQADLYEKTIIPRAENIVSAMQRTYASGQTSMLDLLDAERSLISLRRMLAELKIARERQIADLEAAAALDLAMESNGD